MIELSDSILLLSIVLSIVFSSDKFIISYCNVYYSNTHWQANNSSLSAVNITSAFEGVYRCDATNKAGTTHIVYRVSVIFAATVEDIVAFVDGEGVSVGNAVEVVVSFLFITSFRHNSRPAHSFGIKDTLYSLLYPGQLV